MQHGLQIDSVQMKNFMSVGNVLQTVVFENGVMRIVTGQDHDAPKLKRSGIGKAQPLYAKVHTPYGWKTIGDIKVGDSVSSPDGTTTIVNGVYPQGKRKTVTLTMGDGRRTRACTEHLWKVFTGSSWEVKTTTDIINLANKGETVYIPVIEGVNDYVYGKSCKVPPYLIGLFIACGEIKNNHVRFTVFDDEIEANIKFFLKDRDVSILTHDHGISIVDDTGQFLKDVLEETDRLQWESIIDELNEEQRKDVLRGIFDHLGFEEDNEVKCIFSSKDRWVAKLTQQLSWSLGGISSIKKNIVSDEIMNLVEEFHVYSKFRNSNIFFHSISKKTFGFNESLMLPIKSIINEKEEECVCISVISESKLYITDSFIVTHNTTVPNVLSYAFYNKPVSEIKLNRLPNKTNVKGMYARVDFRKDGKKYSIERGIKPDIFRFIEYDGDKEIEKNETLGTKADTQDEIERIIGMSHALFTMIVTINTIQQPYPKSALSRQRNIIEEILNITELTRKSKILSEYKIKETKAEIEKEKIRIESSITMRKRAEDQLQQSKALYARWEVDQRDSIDRLLGKLSDYEQIDIAAEIKAHEHNAIVKENNTTRNNLLTEKQSTERLSSQGTKRLHEIHQMIESFALNKCPTCKQTIDDGSHKEQEDKLVLEAKEYFSVLEGAKEEIENIDSKINSIKVENFIPVRYTNVQDAYKHQNLIDNTKSQLDNLKSQSNPHIETVKNAEEALESTVVDYGPLELLEKRLTHQQFLFKMLTGRDSFVRKRIIDISIPMLNQHIEYYLRKTDITHDIKFESDLTLEIYNAGSEYDFDSLSRGEQNWSIISLNLAMRDLYEQIHGPINLLFVDELIDFGIDTAQSVDAYRILKGIAKERNKAVSLITHREELFEKADEILFVHKEMGFTSYEVQQN